jgi:tetratricopeptide (TPR) repeat protein
VELSRFDDASASLERAAKILKARRAEGPVAALRYQLFVQCGRIQLLRAQYGAARLSFSRALRAAEEHALGDHALAQALRGLGLAARHTGQLAEAGRLYRRALRPLDPEDETPLVATLLRDVGDLEHARRRLARAETVARRGLELRERSAGAAAVETGADLAGLAAIVQARRRFDEAASLYGRALSVVTSRRLYRWALPRLERILGHHHPLVAESSADFHALEVAVQAEARIKGVAGRLLLGAH